MNTLTSIARSGMNAAQLSLGTAAHNIANQVTPDFRRQQVHQAEQAGGGVTAGIGQAGQAGASLADDLVSLKTGVYSFKANLRVIQAEDDMLGSLLDVKA